jgi:hypothetical protein
VTRYREAFAWTRSIDDFIRWEIQEQPLLHVCSGSSDFGDVTLDKYEPADVEGDWTNLPFESDSFAAVFADPPWNSGYKSAVAEFMREALRVAPIAYLMAPWLYGAAWADLTRVWYRQFPGVHTPVMLTRYERSRQLAFAFPTDPTRLATEGRALPYMGRRRLDQGDDLAG